MLEYTDNGYNIQEFDSFSEVASYLEDISDLKEYKLTNNDYLSQRSHFYGVSSFDGMLDRIRFGDKVQTQAFINELKTPKTTEDDNTGIFMDVEGFAYDMGSVVNGEPECCLNSGSPEPKPSMNIYIDIGYCGGVPVSTINNRGYAIVKLINSLLAKGYILNVYIVHYITVDCHSSKGRLFAQLIKIPTDYLALSTIGYSCTCDFFRVVSWLLTAIQTKRKNYTGNGKSMPSKEILNAIKNRGDMYIPSGYTDSRFDYSGKEEAEKIITEYYNKYCEEKGDKICN